MRIPTSDDAGDSHREQRYPREQNGRPSDRNVGCGRHVVSKNGVTMCQLQNNGDVDSAPPVELCRASGHGSQRFPPQLMFSFALKSAPFDAISMTDHTFIMVTFGRSWSLCKNRSSLEDSTDFSPYLMEGIMHHLAHLASST